MPVVDPIGKPIPRRQFEAVLCLDVIGIAPEFLLRVRHEGPIFKALEGSEKRIASVHVVVIESIPP